MWDEIFDKLAAHAQNHRSTLVFVNTRRLVEKIAFELAERLGAEHVAAHHGSLSRTLRLDAEQRLKNGEIKILIATASLELGIDIGDIDLVCQISTTRAVAVAMQRIGRAGHWRGAIPKGRFFATTRDDLMEQAALIRKMRAGELDQLEIPPQPADVLMQQIVACCGAEPWEEDDALQHPPPRLSLPRPHPRKPSNELITLLSDGIESTRGRYGAYLLRDGVQRHLHPRRGARMIAISNGGSHPRHRPLQRHPPARRRPDRHARRALRRRLQPRRRHPPRQHQLAHPAHRSRWPRPRRRRPRRTAHLPFWCGEAPQRTAVALRRVGELREQISARTPNVTPGYISSRPRPEVCRRHRHVAHGEVRRLRRAAPTSSSPTSSPAAPSSAPSPSKTTIIAERFFDDGGGMQLILHAPFGGRINKAFGLALRKRFCRGFNFELQAAATDNGINISLAEQHSFPLADVFQFLTEHTAKELLEQASIASPIFKTRWRWAANRSLQLLRFSKGKRIAPQIQRTRSEDLMASVFPQAAACFETIEGDIQIPDHPLVDEVMKDVLQEAMDLEGLIEVLAGIQDRQPSAASPSTLPYPLVFAHELLNANPYAFLDEAGLEERRARAITWRGLPGQRPRRSRQARPGRHRRQSAAESWPDIRDEHELHDLLRSLVALPLPVIDTDEARHWPTFYDRLTRTGRAQTIDCAGTPCWIATERLPHISALWHNVTEEVTKEAAMKLCVQGWLQILGPATARSFAHRLALDPSAVFQTFLAMEMQGLLMRGAFEHPATSEDHDIEWCERRILQRIHRRTMSALRKQVEAVSPAVYMRWLLNWQHLAPQTQLAGEEGVLEALHQLEGYEAPAIEWERTLLPARVANYDPRWLDALCLSGAVGWGRISPHPAWSTGDGAAPRRVIPTNAAPITFYIRETADWLPHALSQQCVEEPKLQQALSPEALQLRALLQQRGACFSNDIQRILNLTRQQTQHALWELATAGLAAADGFDQLRAIMDPRRRSTTETPGRRPTRSSAGRWSLLSEEVHAAPTAIEQARRTDAALESAARMLLARYGILFRDLLTRESNAPRWRDLLGILRRLEARGEIRGGRFVTGFGGEQFALPQAVESLRAARHRECSAIISVAAADPINLAGIVIPGDRVPSVPGKLILYRNGNLHQEDAAVTTAPMPDIPSPAMLPTVTPPVHRIVPAMTEQAKKASGPPVQKASSEDEKLISPELGPEDFYYEGPYLVFTAAYHLKRGYCCNSNCRHCPYK